MPCIKRKCISRRGSQGDTVMRSVNFFLILFDAYLPDVLVFVNYRSV